MSVFRNDFNLDDNVIWFNAASEGPLPKVANEALQEAIQWKSNPYQLTIPKFISVPHYLKQSIGKLLHVPLEEIVLGNSATYGLQILAQGLPLKPGDEIITMHNDFPTDILPWVTLAEQGVNLKQVEPASMVLTLEELSNALTDKTRVVCLPHVHTFSGHRLDIKSMSHLCRERGITFVVNVTQSLGNEPIDITEWRVDALVSAGYKWLCGPYGTGFAWFKPSLAESLTVKQAYWSAVLSEQKLSQSDVITPQDIKSMHIYDQYGTANFFNYVPWKASIDYLLDCGLDKVQQHNQDLIQQFIGGVDHDQYQFISPIEREARSNSVIFSHQDPARNPALFETLKKESIYLGFWKGNLRFSPHLYNTADEVTRLLTQCHNGSGLA